MDEGLIGAIVGSTIGILGAILGILGSAVGALGGGIGTYFFIKSAKGPAERRRAVKWAIFAWVAVILVIVLALVLLCIFMSLGWLCRLASA